MTETQSTNAQTADELTRMTEAQFQIFHGELKAVGDRYIEKLSTLPKPEGYKPFVMTPEQEAMHARVSKEMEANLETVMRASVQIVETDDESDMITVDGKLVRKQPRKG